MGKLSRRFEEEIALHVRQLAWLHAIPRPDEAGKGWRPVSRLRQYRNDGIEPPLPPCPHSGTVKLLLEAGPVIQTGQGRAPLTWHELRAFAALPGSKLRGSDIRLLHSLSRDYLSELVEAESEDCPAPWWPESDEGGVEDAIERFFDKL